jgi:tetratricopeptide (TPR) repeat protein
MLKNLLNRSHKANSSGLKSEGVDSLFIQAKLSLNNERFAEALSLYSQAAPMYESLGIRSQNYYICLQTAGSLCYDYGTVDDARAYLSAASRVAREVCEASEVPDFLHKLAAIAYTGGDYGLARELLEMALKVKEQVHPETLGHAMILRNLGALASIENRKTAALEYLEHCLEIQQKNSASLDEIDKTYVSLLNLLSEMGPEFEDEYDDYRFRRGELRMQMSALT